MNDAPASWNAPLLALSFLVGGGAAYLALELAEHARRIYGGRWSGWRAVESFILGYGVWAAHCIALLALESAAASYDPLRLVACGLLGVVFLVPALLPANGRSRRLGGLLAGLGVGAAHLLGLSASSAHAASFPFAAGPLTVWAAGSAAAYALALRLFTAVGGASTGVRLKRKGVAALAWGGALLLADLGLRLALSPQGTGPASPAVPHVLSGPGVWSPLDAGALSLLVVFVSCLALGVAVLGIVMNSDGSEVFYEGHQEV